MILARAWQGFAQSPPTPPPAQAQAPPAAQPQAGEPDKPAEKPPRQSKRTRRTSRRQPVSSGQGSFDETRQSRDAGPTRQDLTFTGNLMGGYDDNLTAGLGSGSGSSPNAMVSGSTVFAGGTLAYFRGNRRHSIRMDGTGTLAGYPGNLDTPAPGAVATIGASTALGRDLTLDVSQRAAYEPFFNAFNAAAGSTPLPPGGGEATSAAGLFERQSVSSNTSASLDRRWSREDATSLSYGYDARLFSEDDSGDSRSHSVTADYRRRLATGVRARAEYRYRNLDTPTLKTAPAPRASIESRPARRSRRHCPGAETCPSHSAPARRTSHRSVRSRDSRTRTGCRRAARV